MEELRNRSDEYSPIFIINNGQFSLKLSDYLSLYILHWSPTLAPFSLIWTMLTSPINSKLIHFFVGYTRVFNKFFPKSFNNMRYKMCLKCFKIRITLHQSASLNPRASHIGLHAMHASVHTTCTCMFQFYIFDFLFVCFVLFCWPPWAPLYNRILFILNFIIPCSVDGSCPSVLERDSNISVSTSCLMVKTRPVKNKVKIFSYYLIWLPIIGVKEKNVFYNQIKYDVPINHKNECSSSSSSSFIYTHH